MADLCGLNPYPMQFEATLTINGNVYTGPVTWVNDTKWYFSGYDDSGKYERASYNTGNESPTATLTGIAQRICGMTGFTEDQWRASGLKEEGGSRRHKSKQQKTRKSNQSKKRNSRKANRHRR
jgi:hypothetical protein